jgi:hypothetical protein
LRNKVAFVLLLLYAAVAVGQSRWNREGELSTDMNSHAEFAFTRIIFKSGYSTLPGPGNHGATGQRLMRISSGA